MARRRKSGSGTVRERKDGRWEGRVLVGYDEKGLPKTKSVFGKTKRECEQKLKALKEEVSATSIKIAPEMKFGAWMDYWFNTYSKGKLNEYTQQTYWYRIYTQIIPKIGETPLNQVRTGTLEKFYSELKKRGNLDDTDGEKGLAESFIEPSFHYDPAKKHYVAELIFGQRFVIGADGQKQMGAIPVRGGLAGVSTDIPLIPGAGITARASASSMTYAAGSTLPMYSTLAGGYWNFHFARILEFQAHLMAGCSWMNGNSGIDLAAGAGLSLITDSNFKLKAFADFESLDFGRGQPWTNTVVVGWSSAWFW